MHYNDSSMRTCSMPDATSVGSFKLHKEHKKIQNVASAFEGKLARGSMDWYDPAYILPSAIGYGNGDSQPEDFRVHSYVTRFTERYALQSCFIHA